MNNEVIHKQVIQMAESCGFSRTHTGEVELWLCNKNDLEAFAKLVAKEMREYMVFQATPNDWMKEHIAAEREACAQICENFSDTDSYDGGITTEYHAILIRQRGKA
jgi:hypothetical protein